MRKKDQLAGVCTGIFALCLFCSLFAVLAEKTVLAEETVHAKDMVHEDSPFKRIEGLWAGPTWDSVLILGRYALYTDAYDFAVGVMEFEHVDTNRYVGIWRETAGRSGTLEIRILSDEDTIVGAYSTNDSIRKGRIKKDSRIYWQRKTDEKTSGSILEKARHDFQDVQSYLMLLTRALRPPGTGPSPKP